MDFLYAKLLLWLFILYNNMWILGGHRVPVLKIER